MDKNKKKVLTFIAILLIVIALLAVILSLLIKNEDNPSTEKPGNSSNNNSPSSITISKDIERLNDATTFFQMQKTINNYYEIITNQNTNDLYNILDSDYKNEHHINTSNIYSYISFDYEMISYTAKEIYYNPNSSITYYFISGYLIDTPMIGEDFKFYDNINYLIIVDNTNHYTIRPLDNDIDIADYAKNYNIVKKDIANDFTLTRMSVSEENKLTTYLNEYLNLLIYNSDKAYSLLDNKTKAKYNGLSDFKTKVIDIYTTLSSKIFAYSSKASGNKIIYSVIDDNQNDITIYEEYVMDFKIAY